MQVSRRREASPQRAQNETTVQNNAELKQNFQKLSSTAHESRPKEVMQLLRNTEVGTDGTVCAEEKTFKIHCAIVGWLSPTFYETFLENKQATEPPCMKISNVSSKTVSVVLDFAYGICVTQDLSQDIVLAAEVALLSEKCRITQLGIMTSEIVPNSITVENCPRLYEIFAKAVVFNWMTRNAMQDMVFKFYG